MSNSIKELFDYDLIKNCSKCGSISLKTNYYKDERASDGLQSACKNCMNSYTKSYHTKNKEKMKKFYIDYHQANKDKILLYKKQYYQINKEKINNKIKQRKDEDINFRLACNLRKRVGNAFKAQKSYKKE